MNTTNNYLSEKLKKNNVVKFNKHSVTLANYSPYSISNNMLFISGQLPIVDGNLKYVGKIDHDLKKNEAEKAILICISNILWIVSSLIDENSISQYKKVKCLNLKGYFNTKSNFNNHSSLLDIASDIMVKVLGKKNGVHSRVAIGCESLPKNSPVEIEAIFSIY